MTSRSAWLISSATRMQWAFIVSRRAGNDTDHGIRSAIRLRHFGYGTTWYGASSAKSNMDRSALGGAQTSMSWPRAISPRMWSI